MVDIYNLTNVSAATTPGDFMTQMVLLSEGAIAMSLIAVIGFGIILISRKMNIEMSSSFIGAGSLMMILAIVFIILEWVTVSALSIPILFLIPGFLMRVWGK